MTRRQGYVVLSVTAAAVGLGALGYRYGSARLRPAVSVVIRPHAQVGASESPGSPAGGRRSGALGARNAGLASAGAQAPGGAVVPDRAPDLFDGNQLVDRLTAAGQLTNTQRKDLQEVLKTVADMQFEILRFDDPARRAELQEKLIYQLVLRLRLVLGEEQSKPIAEVLSAKNPQVVYDGEN